jgi:hypothetical protein
MGVSQSDMDTDMKSNFSDMRSDINSYRSPYRCFSFAVYLFYLSCAEVNLCDMK